MRVERQDRWFLAGLLAVVVGLGLVSQRAKTDEPVYCWTDSATVAWTGEHCWPCVNGRFELPRNALLCKVYVSASNWWGHSVGGEATLDTNTNTWYFSFDAEFTSIYEVNAVTRAWYQEGTGLSVLNWPAASFYFTTPNDPNP